MNKLGIDINAADNGVLLPTEVHNGLGNDHTYMDAVYNALRNAKTKEEAIALLQRIGDKLLNDTFPRVGRCINEQTLSILGYLGR